ncbi:hypothetical protein N9826_04710 [Flavobacteriaceae bacterium]|nr:hypothetical protein [Flavobacteriaceae bacterium]
MDYKTSWSNTDLRKLTKVENHKIVFDGYEYTWYRKLEDEWEIHYIRTFKEKKKAFSYLKYNIFKWRRELNNRTDDENRGGAYKHIEKMLVIQEKTYSIAFSSLPTIEKIIHIRLINEDVSVDELSIILKLNKSIIYRHIRTLKSRGTLLCA